MLSFFKEIRIYLGIIFLLIGSLIALMYFSLPKGLEEFSLSLPADEEIKYERETIKLGQQDDNGVIKTDDKKVYKQIKVCLLYTSPSPRDRYGSRMPSSA